MTEKERKEEFNNPENWSPSVEFPSSGMIRVMCFEFYGMVFYDLQIYRDLYAGEDKDWKPVMKPGFASKFYFIKSTSKECLEEVTKTRCYELMKEAEQK